MVDGNAFGDAGFKYLGVPYSEMDCQAFVEKCLSDCGMHKDLAGSNAWYRYVMNNGWVGTPEECVKAMGCVPKGAMLFILEHDGKEPPKYRDDGIGNASHIGICTGSRGEGAIHSSASRGCVAESVFKGKTIKNGGWNRVGLWDQITFDYSGGDTPEPTPTPTPAEIAVVGNVPPGRKQEVNLRKRPSTLSALIDRVPCGDTVEVAIKDDDWSLVKWHNKTGYMMTEFLLFDGDDTPDELYCVTIHDLTEQEANDIVAQYGGSITKERG